MNLPDRLPRRPSALIRAALADLAKVEADPTYAVDMTSWHGMNWVNPIHPDAAEDREEDMRELCCVCLAGAMMAKTFKVPYGDSATPRQLLLMEEVSAGDMNALEALDELRAGNVHGAFRDLRMDVPTAFVGRAYVEVADYDQDRAEFRADMERLADELEEAGA